MKKIIFATLVLVLCSCNITEVYMTDSDISEPYPEIVPGDFFKGEWNTRHATVSNANNLFAIKLFKEVSMKAADNNVLISPYSVQLALSMAACGANGNTQEEIIRTLGFGNSSIQDVNEYNALMQTELESADPNATFSIANGFWSSNEIWIKDQFRNVMYYYYKAQAKNLDFIGGKAEPIINDWVSSKTNGKINNFFMQGELRDAVAVLVNALYFKGKWHYAFDPDETNQSLFMNYDGTTSVVDMMQINHFFAYSRVKDGQLLSMPFANNIFSFDILLPNEGVDINTYMANLDADNIPLLDFNETDLIYVRMPKLKAEVETDLVELLQNMGIHDAFHRDLANFYGMSDFHTFITNVMQKAFIDVNEAGCEAAAVTGVEVGVESNIDNPNTFFVERPFIYLIRDHNTGTILFMGKVMKL